MTYIVIDLEWNQAMSSKSSVFNHLPIHLRGEIIQIGAVKLDENFAPADEFQCDVRPVWFRKIHYKVKKLTGFNEERLANGLSFPEAVEKFLAWCGPECMFMTWGYDDRGIMEQNLIIHDLDIDWLGPWVNLQLIYNQQTGGDRNQKSLETAMEHFEIPQTRTAHDALGDAYNTALVCSHMDMPYGLSHYGELINHLSRRTHSDESAEQGPDPIEHTASDSYYTKEALWEAENTETFTCPVCKSQLPRTNWINQGARRYMALATCETDGAFLYRIRLCHEETGAWHANRLIYQADEHMLASYNERQGHPRKHRKRRRSSAEKV